MLDVFMSLVLLNLTVAHNHIKLRKGSQQALKFACVRCIRLSSFRLRHTSFCLVRRTQQIFNCHSMRCDSLLICLTLILNMLTCNLVGAGKLLTRVVNLKKLSTAGSARNFCVAQAAIQKTGVFIGQLPEVYPSEIYFKKALKKTREIKIDPTIKNLRNANRKLSAQILDGLMKALTMPITNLLNIYKKEMRELHPYELTVVELTVVARVKAGHPDLKTVLADLKELRASTSKLAKEYAAKAKVAPTAMDARDLMVEGTRALEGLYNTSEKATALKELGEIQKVLRRIPVIELNTPTVVLVGAPNVGKSSIVRAVSTGTPEVNDYPFTTRGVTVGHIVDKAANKRYQVMDTPGLLDRPSEERNEMEKLTFASMLHLPTAVIFVVDPTGLSGEKSTLTAQLNVREHLKYRFPRRPWLDVVSKADIELGTETLARLPEGHLRVSVHSGVNMKPFLEQLESMCASLEPMVAPHMASE